MQRGTRPSRRAHDYKRVCALNANAAAPGPSPTAPCARAGRQLGEGWGKPGPAARPGGAGEPGSPLRPRPARGPKRAFLYLRPGHAVPVLREGPALALPGAQRPLLPPRPAAKPSRPPRETAPPHQGSCRRQRRSRTAPAQPPWAPALRQPAERRQQRGAAAARPEDTAVSLSLKIQLKNTTGFPV